MDLVSRKRLRTLVVGHQRGESEHVTVIYRSRSKTRGGWSRPNGTCSNPTPTSCSRSCWRSPTAAPSGVGNHPRSGWRGARWPCTSAAPLPQGQAHIESLFGHVKTEWPHLEQIRDPAVLDAELERVRHDDNTVRLRAGMGYVTPI